MKMNTLEFLLKLMQEQVYGADVLRESKNRANITRSKCIGCKLFY